MKPLIFIPLFVLVALSSCSKMDQLQAENEALKAENEKLKQAVEMEIEKSMAAAAEAKIQYEKYFQYKELSECKNEDEHLRLRNLAKAAELEARRQAEMAEQAAVQARMAQQEAEKAKQMAEDEAANALWARLKAERAEQAALVAAEEAAKQREIALEEVKKAQAALEKCN